MLFKRDNSIKSHPHGISRGKREKCVFSCFIYSEGVCWKEEPLTYKEVNVKCCVQLAGHFWGMKEIAASRLLPSRKTAPTFEGHSLV